MKISNKTYDVLKDLCTNWIPALVMLIATVLGILQVPGSTIAAVTGILGAVGTFIGRVINLSTEAYWKEKEDGCL